MKETGILFTPEHIRKILADQKVQTRRVVKWEGADGLNLDASSLSASRLAGSKWALMSMGGSCWNERAHATCPHGSVGDRLYIKEGVITHASIPQLVGYYLDGCRLTEPWEARRTAMFMPKWAARTWLEITNIRVQRVQEISEADCVAEGCPKDYLLGRNWYKNLWDEINGKKHPWASNPFCWCLTFRRVQP